MSCDQFSPSFHSFISTNAFSSSFISSFPLCQIPDYTLPPPSLQTPSLLYIIHPHHSPPTSKNNRHPPSLQPNSSPSFLRPFRRSWWPLHCGFQGALPSQDSRRQRWLKTSSRKKCAYSGQRPQESQSRVERERKWWMHEIVSMIERLPMRDTNNTMAILK